MNPTTSGHLVKKRRGGLLRFDARRRCGGRPLTGAADQGAGVRVRGRGLGADSFRMQCSNPLPDVERQPLSALAGHQVRNMRLRYAYRLSNLVLSHP